MNVSIIIVNYNTKALIEQTIESILKETKEISYEIIVVDNASTDESVNYLKKKYEKRIVLVEKNENLGFGRANNEGVKYAKGKYLFFLNPDTILIENSIKQMYDYMESNLNSNVAACGGNLYTLNLKPNFSYKKKLYSNYTEFAFIKEKFFKYILEKNLNFNYSNKEIKVEYISGANIFIRKEIFFEIGKFDSDFFMYFEETELLSRVLKRRYEIVSIPWVKIIHLEGQSNKVNILKWKFFFESKYKYFYKVYSLREAKINYLISQFKYIIFPLKNIKIKFKINQEEYQKFLQNYKNLRKDD